MKKKKKEKKKKKKRRRERKNVSEEDSRQAIQLVVLTGLLLAVGLEGGPGVGDTHAALGFVADLEGLVTQRLVVFHLGLLDVDGRLALAVGEWELLRPSGWPCDKKTVTLVRLRLLVDGDSIVVVGSPETHQGKEARIAQQTERILTNCIPRSPPKESKRVRVCAPSAVLKAAGTGEHA